MKYIKLFVFTLITLVVTISCGNKDTENIIIIKKASTERLIDAFAKFEDNFMLRSDITDNGYEQVKFLLTDYDVQGPKAEEMLQKAGLSIDSIIKNKIGITSRFVNDKKAQAFKFSYAFNNILKSEEQTDLINVVIGQKNIEAASPVIFNKTFSLPAKDIKKALALIAPESIPANFNIDLGYNALKPLSYFRPDKASQKRYDKAQNILYKNAVITRDGDMYSIILNNDDVIKSISASIYAVKNDNRLKVIWSIYEKLLEKEFKEIEEKFNTEIKDKIKDCAFTEELIVKDSLVVKDMYTVVVNGKEIVKLEFGIKNYENPIDGMTYKLNITDPKAADKESGANMISCVFASKGAITDTTADIDYSASVSVTNVSDDSKISMDFSTDTEYSPLSGLDMHCSFYADTTKQADNFKIDMDVIARNNLDSESDGVQFTSLNLAMRALGSVAKTSEMITYKIDTIDMEIAAPDNEQYIARIGTDTSVIYSKNILEDITMPTETVRVLETKVNEWQSIKDEITANIVALSSLLNL